MSDLELAVSYFLPDVWTPGMKWLGRDIPCPEPSWEIAGRLLEAMLKRYPTATFTTVYPHIQLALNLRPVTSGIGWIDDGHADGRDPIDAIIAAAAALARKEQGK